MRALRFALRCLFVLVLLTLTLGFVAGHFLSERARALVRIDATRLSDDALGMTEEKIVGIVGAPPGDWSSGAVWPPAIESPLGQATPKYWLFDSEVITVWFENGKAVHITRDKPVRKRTWIDEASDAAHRVFSKRDD